MLCAVFSRVKVTHVGRIKKRVVGPSRVEPVRGKLFGARQFLKCFFFQYSYEYNMKDGIVMQDFFF